MLNVNWEKIHSIILSVTCHGLRNFPLLIHIPLISICEFFETLWVIIFWVRVTHKMLNLNWEKIQSTWILSVTCHGLRNFPLLMTHPLISICEFFETLWVIIFWVRVTHKKLNVNSSTWITHPPTPPLHDPPHPTPAWHTPPHLYMTPHPTPPLHDPPHTCMTHPTPCMTHPPHPTPTWPTPPHPTPAWHTPPNPTPPHPCITHPTPPLHHTPHPTHGTFLGTKEPFFMGCFTMSPSR